MIGLVLNPRASIASLCWVSVHQTVWEGSANERSRLVPGGTTRTVRAWRVALVDVFVV